MLKLRKMKKNEEEKMKRVKILGIAPYPELKELMAEIAAQRNDVDPEIYVGDYRDCIEILETNMEKEYQVIISRGQTAVELSRRIPYIPVIDISVSVYDILRAVRLAKSSCLEFAVIGFPSLTSEVLALRDLLEEHFPVYTVSSESETTALIKELKQEGISMTLGGMITTSCSSQYGMSSILISSGKECIENAFDRAVELSNYYTQIQNELHFYKNILYSHKSRSVIVSEEGRILFSTADYRLARQILDKSKKEIRLTLKYGKCTYFKRIEDIQYAVRCTRESIENRDYCSCEFEPTHIPAKIDKYGISYLDCDSVEKEVFSSNIIPFLSGNYTEQMDALLASENPILITGEPYCYKSMIAKYLYTRSLKRTAPLIIIDCNALESKGWHFLADSEDSPLNENGCTILIDNLAYLEEEKRQFLLAYMMSNLLCKRNRVFFVHTESENNDVREYLTLLTNELYCLHFRVPPLRDCLDHLENYVSLYLNHKNQSSTMPVSGFDAETILLLKKYSWPFNYKQFERVLEKLYVSSNHGKIVSAETGAILGEEAQLYNNNILTFDEPPTPKTGEELDLSLTLAEINRDIVNIVLNQCNGNQRAAAKQLGIGRTTLWRMLK